jgi:hypothetical protein
MRTNLSILAAAAALLVLAPAASVATASPSTAPAKTVRLQRALDAVVAAGVPGAIVLVRDGDRTIRLASGYGNLARRTPMRASDRFRVGSETKMFVSTVVLQLVGEGKLSLDDTVGRRLPELVPNGRSITVRQLLSHTSGLFDYAEDKAFIRQIDDPRKRWAPRQLVELATARRPLFAPGTRHSYSNTGCCRERRAPGVRARSHHDPVWTMRRLLGSRRRNHRLRDVHRLERRRHSRPRDLRQHRRQRPPRARRASARAPDRDRALRMTMSSEASPLVSASGLDAATRRVFSDTPTSPT